jgi:hypothetical protein
MAAPTYTGIMQNTHKKRPEVMEFFFCNDDIERCVKVGTIETGHPKYLASEDRDQPLQKGNP